MVLVCGLYVLPASMVWFEHFQQPGPVWQLRAVEVVVLLPAVVNALLSPFRENLAMILTIPLLAALFAGRRPPLKKLIPASLVLFLLISIVVGSYRRVRWGGIRPAELADEIRAAGPVDWLTGSWGEPMRRFHGFDSMLMTVSLVPSAQPYSGRNVLGNPFVRAFLPRIVYSGKALPRAPLRFAQTIWTYTDPAGREMDNAFIAPSMPGDLYSAGGVLFIALGGFIWGAVLGLIDGWKRYLAPFCCVGLTALLAQQCAMSVERDFDHTIAATLETLLCTGLIAWLISVSQRGSATQVEKLRDSTVW
jgi:hypothetical protein